MSSSSSSSRHHKLGNLIHLHQPQNSTSSLSLPFVTFTIPCHQSSSILCTWFFYPCSNFVDRIMNLTFHWPMPYIRICKFLSTCVQYIWLKILKKLWLLLVMFLSSIPNGQKTLTNGTELWVSKLYSFDYVRKWLSHAWLDFLSAWSIKFGFTHLIP
jgi:hypothetical protein